MSLQQLQVWFTVFTKKSSFYIYLPEQYIGAWDLLLYSQVNHIAKCGRTHNGRKDIKHIFYPASSFMVLPDSVCSLLHTSFNKDFIIATQILMGSTCSNRKRANINNVGRIHRLHEIKKRLFFTTEVISSVMEEVEVVHVLWSWKFIIYTIQHMFFK